MGIFEALGLKRPKSRVAVGSGARSADPGQQAAGPGDDSSAPPPVAATPYDDALAAAQAALATLTEPEAAIDKAKIQSELVSAAQAKAAKEPKAAIKLLEQVADRVAAAKKAAAALAAYLAERNKVVQEVDALNKHPSASRIASRFAPMNVKLGKAQDHADKREFAPALKLLAEVAKAATEARLLADQYADFAKKRAEAAALLRSLSGSWDVKVQLALLKLADSKVKGEVPDFKAALKLLEQARSKLLKDMHDAWVAPNQALIDALKKLPAAPWAMDPEINQIEAMQAQMVADIAAGNWSPAVMASKRLPWLIHPVTKMVTRRSAFEGQLAKTMAAMTPLNARPELKDTLVDMDVTRGEAAVLAERGAMQFEKGAALLATLEQRCAQFVLAVAAADKYKAERAAVTQRLAVLEKHAAAAKIATALSSVRKQLGDAGSVADQAYRGGVPVQGWESARATVARAASDLQAAAELADSFGPILQVRDNAAKAGDKEAARRSLEELRKQAAGLRGAPHADVAAAEFKKFDAAWAQADAEVGEKGGEKTVATALVAAADALVAAQTMQNEHGRFASARLSVAGRLDQLQKHKVAKSIQKFIDPVAKSLTDGDAHDKAADYPAALAALRAADDAATEAHEVAARREAFDTVADGHATKIAKHKDKAHKAELEKLLAEARSKADAFDFEGADRSLDAIEVHFAGDRVKALAKSNPGGKELVAAAKKMMDKGGGKELDALIGSLPDGTDKRAVIALAQERFGIEFTAAANSDAKTVKHICGVFAKVPDDVRGNLSLKKVVHTKPSDNGGAYGTDGGEIELNGRPDQSDQDFGANIADELPPDVEPDCQPKDESPVDYLDFAALHEVGHSVDDANNFMESRQKDAAYGGWIAHGSDVGPIADAVAGDIGGKLGVPAAPELKAYVLGRILRTGPATPTAPSGTDAKAWSDAIVAIEDWYKLAVAQNAWWSDSKSNALKIGDRVYQMAYEQDWVSYLYSARKQALTGYQFRAAGEWFAELYAAYHSGKLKDTHPAVAWLSKLTA